MDEILRIVNYIPFWAHWTTILHYLMLVGCIFMLFASGDDTSIIYLLTIAFLAMTTGVALFVSELSLSEQETGRLVIFLMRVIMFAIPALIAGLSKAEAPRAAGLALALLVGVPLLAITFISCLLGGGIGDPRLMSWCSIVAQ